ncbi:MAG: DNA primase, partial [Gammaproteobacteria bacterium]|nr:DNA primase [Gammaproteobacteria bacterium]
MSGLIPQDFIEELLSRTDIVGVVGARVNLRKTGQNYVGLCPFHNEKSPSFSVSADKQFYYCFGCQESGSALRFVMEFENIDFVAAVEQLAGNLGLEVPRLEGAASKTREAQQSRRKSLYDILGQASNFYKTQLREHPARDRAVNYLKHRGINGRLARDYEVGYAPEGWDNLRRALGITNQDTDLLIQAGLLVDNPEEKKTYDRFRHRVVFPIKDIRGRVVGFGGRVLGDGKPKYLNSPETDVFHKGRELYGLYEARRANRELRSLLVVEGYMDVISLSQHGITNAVATLGTATTLDHLERLYRLVPEVIFCFDGDRAGRGAAWKALETALPLLRDGRGARFLFLPEGEDPDTLVRSQGADKFRHLLDHADFLPDFFFDRLSAEVRLDTFEGKAALSKEALALIQKLPDSVFRQLMMDRLAKITGLASERLAEFGSAQSREIPVQKQPEHSRETQAYKSREPLDSSAIVEPALRLLLKQPELALAMEMPVYERLSALSEYRLLCEMAQKVTENPHLKPDQLLASFQASSQFDYLRKLSEAEVLLSVDTWKAEYEGIVFKLLNRLDEE